MSALTLKHQQGHVLAQDPLRALEHIEFCTLDVNLENGNSLGLAEVVIQAHSRNLYGFNLDGWDDQFFEGGSGLVSVGNEEFAVSCLRVNSPRLDQDIIERERLT